MPPLKVFILDDDRDLAECLAMALEGRGHQVTVAHSGEEAVERFRHETFDLAFFDVRLPGISGVECLRRIRAFQPEARVVMITGYSVDEELEEAAELGARGILHKPFSPLRLFDFLGEDGRGGAGEQGEGAAGDSDRRSQGGARAPQETLAGERRGDRRRKAVLIADDDEDFCQMVADLLANHGYRTATASTGRQAVQRMRDNGFDILLLDLRMPELDGVDALLEMQRSGHAVPTLVTTAYATEERAAMDRLPEATLRRVLRKPFAPQALLDELALLG